MSHSKSTSHTLGMNSYQHGFGDLNTEFWYGLCNIHCLTTREQVDLRIELKYANGTDHTYTYQHFVVDGPEDKYTLHIGQLQEPIPGRDNMAYNNGRPFSTYDNDNDAWSDGNCALSSMLVHSGRGDGGGWWFDTCSYGVLTHPHPHITWYPSGSAINSVEMKVHPKQCGLQEQQEPCDKD